MTDWNAFFSARGRSLKPSAIREAANLANQPGVTSLAGGSPNPALFPFEAIARSMAEIMADPKRRADALQYAATEGYAPLRDFIVDYLAAAGARVRRDEVLITNGSQQALELLGKLFVEPGERVVVSNPTYLGALQAFSLFEPVFEGVPTREEGLDLTALERRFARRPKFMYLMPDCGNPTGTTLPLAQRHEILALSQTYGVPLIEDQAYDQLRLSSTALPSLLALDRGAAGVSGTVIYIGTFSKSLVPGLRVGWIVAPRPVIEKLVPLKQASDLHTGALNQMIVCDVAPTILAGHAETLRAAYRARRDAMLRALERHMPEGVTWTRPEGGMFVWLALPEGLDATELQGPAAREERVAFVPGAPFFVDGSGANTLRLSFSLASEEAIEAAIERLARLIRRSLRDTSTGSTRVLVEQQG